MVRSPVRSYHIVRAFIVCFGSLPLRSLCVSLGSQVLRTLIVRRRPVPIRLHQRYVLLEAWAVSDCARLLFGMSGGVSAFCNTLTLEGPTHAVRALLTCAD